MTIQLLYEDHTHLFYMNSLKSQLTTLLPGIPIFIYSVIDMEIKPDQYAKCLQEVSIYNEPGDITIFFKKDQFVDKGVKGASYVNKYGTKNAVGVVIMKAAIYELESVTWHEIIHIMGLLSATHQPLHPYLRDELEWYPTLEVVRYILDKLNN